MGARIARCKCRFGSVSSGGRTKSSDGGWTSKVWLRCSRKAIETNHHRPRYPDFLSMLVALSNCMRLSLKKAAHAGPVWRCVTGNRGYAGANLGHPALRLLAEASLVPLIPVAARGGACALSAFCALSARTCSVLAYFACGMASPAYRTARRTSRLNTCTTRKPIPLPARHRP
jgi:hypothetical protein